MRFLKNAVFRDMTPCSLEKFVNVSEEPATLAFNPEDRMGRFLVNIFKFLPLDGFLAKKILLLLLFTVTAVITPNFTLEAPRNSAPAAAPTSSRFIQNIPPRHLFLCSLTLCARRSVKDQI
jgi:hypothetical protein